MHQVQHNTHQSFQWVFRTLSITNSFLKHCHAIRRWRLFQWSGSTSLDRFFCKNLLSPPPHMICSLDDTINRHSTTTCLDRFFHFLLSGFGPSHEGRIVDHIPIAFHISAICLPVSFPFSQSCLDWEAHRKGHHNTYSIQVYRQLTMSTLRMSGLAIQDHPQTPSGDTPEASR